MACQLRRWCKIGHSHLSIASTGGTIGRRVVSRSGYWIQASYESTSNLQIPTKAQEITITQNPAQPGTAASYAITGAPLILEFRNLLLRTPVPPEGDVVFTVGDLSDWANWFWRSVQ